MREDLLKLKDFTAIGVQEGADGVEVARRMAERVRGPSIPLEALWDGLTFMSWKGCMVKEAHTAEELTWSGSHQDMETAIQVNWVGTHSLRGHPIWAVLPGFFILPKERFGNPGTHASVGACVNSPLGGGTTLSKTYH